MVKRDFDEWLKTFQETNATFSYWVDFNKVIQNADKFKVELNILNSLIGSENIGSEFIRVIEKYPECLKCVPLLIAVRGLRIKQIEGVYDFSEQNAKNSFSSQKESYIEFMKKTGLFDILKDKKIKNLYDYVVGVEVGLDTNARKNRGGAVMSKIISDYLDKHKINYAKEVYASELEKKYKLDLSSITNKGKADKRFDFVIENKGIVYGIEVNFYSGGGSKLNETARSYGKLTEHSKDIKGFKFVWITDGFGWNSAKKNLKETFDILDNMFNLNDLFSGKFIEILK